MRRACCFSFFWAFLDTSFDFDCSRFSFFVTLDYMPSSFSLLFLMFPLSIPFSTSTFDSLHLGFCAPHVLPIPLALCSLPLSVLWRGVGVLCSAVVWSATPCQQQARQEHLSSNLQQSTRYLSSPRDLSLFFPSSPLGTPVPATPLPDLNINTSAPDDGSPTAIITHYHPFVVGNSFISPVQDNIPLYLDSTPSALRLRCNEHVYPSRLCSTGRRGDKCSLMTAYIWTIFSLHLPPSPGPHLPKSRRKCRSTCSLLVPPLLNLIAIVSLDLLIPFLYFSLTGCMSLLNSIDISAVVLHHHVPSFSHIPYCIPCCFSCIHLVSHRNIP